MTKPITTPEGRRERPTTDRRCRWCRIVLQVTPGPGRPKEFCSQRCRQWDWVSRQRAEELSLSESELVIARAELDDLRDLLYVLQCAVDDARRDLASPRQTVKSLKDTLDWVLEAADAVVSADIRSGLGSSDVNLRP